MRGRLLPVCALVLLAAAQCAPANHGGGAADALAAGDSLRGTLHIVGSEPGTWIVVQTAAGADVVLLGERRALEQLAGLEVTVWGERTAAGRLEVERFAVRAAHGVPAVDGVLERAGDGYILVTGDGTRLAVPVLPAALRGEIGVRVWLAGPLDRMPDSFGVIRP